METPHTSISTLSTPLTKSNQTLDSSEQSKSPYNPKMSTPPLNSHQHFKAINAINAFNALNALNALNPSLLQTRLPAKSELPSSISVIWSPVKFMHKTVIPFKTAVFMASKKSHVEQKI